MTEQKQKLVQDVQAVETQAATLGLHITRRALNNAKNALGWELAKDVLRAAAAAKGERVK